MAERIEGRKLEGEIVGLYWAPGKSFVSEPLERMALTFAGIPGDKHSGETRPSGPREPWYPRGTPMRNERQLSILSLEELQGVAADLAIPELRPEWVGANIVVAGVDGFSQLPPRTMLMFPSGATVRIDGDNAPCRKSGKAIAQNCPERPDLEFGFVKAAMHRRGLVGWVECEGELTLGMPVTLRVWEQAVYRG